MTASPRNPSAACYHFIWNFSIGCTHKGRGCRYCCVQQRAGTYWQFAEKGVTKRLKDGRFVWNGRVWIAPPDSDVWLEPLLFPGAGQFIFVNLMSDCAHEAIPIPVIRYAFQTVAASRHFGIFLTHRPERLARAITTASPDEVRLWKPKLLLGPSVSDQAEFDAAWAVLRPLAVNGWRVAASLSPLLDYIVLPQDYLDLACWTIISGEQGEHERTRDMDPEWARAIFRQCDKVGIPLFLREMSRNEIIPNDLLRHDFPTLTINKRTVPPELR